MNAESKNKFASFHIKQALGLNLTFISIGLLISNFSNMQIYISFWVFFTVLWVYYQLLKEKIKQFQLLEIYIKNYLKVSKMNLQHLVREPKISLEKNPLLLLLHGYGSNEEDLFSFAAELPDDSFVISVRAPYNLEPYGHAWYAIHFDADENKFSDNEQAKESVVLIGSFIDEIVKQYPIDIKNVTLIGFSQGAILSYATALTYPEKISKVVALSGYFNQDLAPEVIDTKGISHLKFFISHGTVDQVIPIDWARKAKPALENLGLEVVYHEYSVGHGVAPQNFFDFKNWLIQNNNK